MKRKVCMYYNRKSGCRYKMGDCPFIHETPPQSSFNSTQPPHIPQSNPNPFDNRPRYDFKPSIDTSAGSFPLQRPPPHRPYLDEPRHPRPSAGRGMIRRSNFRLGPTLNPRPTDKPRNNDYCPKEQSETGCIDRRNCNFHLHYGDNMLPDSNTPINIKLCGKTSAIQIDQNLPRSIESMLQQRRSSQNQNFKPSEDPYIEIRLINTVSSKIDFRKVFVWERVVPENFDAKIKPKQFNSFVWQGLENGVKYLVQLRLIQFENEFQKRSNFSRLTCVIPQISNEFKPQDLGATLYRDNSGNATSNVLFSQKAPSRYSNFISDYSIKLSESGHIFLRNTHSSSPSYIWQDLKPETEYLFCVKGSFDRAKVQDMKERQMIPEESDYSEQLRFKITAGFESVQMLGTSVQDVLYNESRANEASKREEPSNFQKPIRRLKNNIEIEAFHNSFGDFVFKTEFCSFYQRTKGCDVKKCQKLHFLVREECKNKPATLSIFNMSPDMNGELLEQIFAEQFGGDFQIVRFDREKCRARIVYRTWDQAQPAIDCGFLDNGVNKITILVSNVQHQGINMSSFKSHDNVRNEFYEKMSYSEQDDRYDHYSSASKRNAFPEQQRQNLNALNGENRYFRPGNDIPQQAPPIDINRNIHENENRINANRKRQVAQSPFTQKDKLDDEIKRMKLNHSENLASLNMKNINEIEALKQKHMNAISDMRQKFDEEVASIRKNVKAPLMPSKALDEIAGLRNENEMLRGRLHDSEQSLSIVSKSLIDVRKQLESVEAENEHLRLAQKSQNIEPVKQVNASPLTIPSPTQNLNHQMPVQPLIDESEQQYEIERIVSHEQRPDGQLQFEIKQLGYGDEHNEFVPSANLNGAESMINAYFRSLNSNQN